MVYLDLWVGNNNVVEVQALTNAATEVVDNAATVVCTSILDSDGDVVTGETFPVTMGYVAASSGIYRGTLASAIAITAGPVYTVIIDATGTGGEVGHWEVEARAKTRSAVIRTV